MPPTLDRAKEIPRYILIDRAEEFLGAYEFGELNFPFRSRAASAARRR